MMILKLKALYVDIKNHNLTFDVFNYKHNNIEFEILFDINTSPFRLLFMKKRTPLFLVIEVGRGFKIDTYLKADDLNLLKQMLEITNGITSFSTNTFFTEFNLKIPKKLSKQTPSNRVSIATAYDVEEKNLIYLKELRNWEKNPESNKHVTAENREKTRVLYPKLYDILKNKDVSVVYTAAPLTNKIEDKLIDSFKIQHR